MSRAPVAILLGLAIGACAREPAPARPAAEPVPSAPAATPAPPAVPRPAASPIAVLVSLEASGDSPLTQEWLRELQAVMAANPGQFRTVKTAQEADLGVRIEGVVSPPDSPGHQLLTLWLSVGKESKRWTLDYTGGPAVMAGRLAHFFVTQVEAARPGSAGKPQSP